MAYNMTELKLAKQHRAACELCYQRQGGAVLLYDDTAAPRVLIATESGSDLDGWQGRGDCEKLVEFWQQVGRFSTWRAALADSAMSYIY